MCVLLLRLDAQSVGLRSHNLSNIPRSSLAALNKRNTVEFRAPFSIATKLGSFQLFPFISIIPVYQYKVAMVSFQRIWLAQIQI